MYIFYSTQFSIFYSILIFAFSVLWVNCSLFDCQERLEKENLIIFTSPRQPKWGFVLYNLCFNFYYSIVNLFIFFKCTIFMKKRINLKLEQVKNYNTKSKKKIHRMTSPLQTMSTPSQIKNKRHKRLVKKKILYKKGTRDWFLTPAMGYFLHASPPLGKSSFKIFAHACFWGSRLLMPTLSKYSKHHNSQSHGLLGLTHSVIMNRYALFKRYDCLIKPN